ncbi:MAG: glycosyltransferase family 39 protein [Casimicrobium sp.]
MKLTKNILLVLLAIWVVAWFGTLELRGLFIPDEGRYAEIPREMVATGDWVTPRVNNIKFFEKPPLQYWLTAMSLSVFGDDEWSARLPAALLGFLAVLATGFTARVLWGKDGAVATAVVLASSWAFYLCSQYLTVDMSLTAFLTLALCSFLLAQRSSDNSVDRAGRLWMFIAWISCALAVLSKGLIGIVLPALTLIFYSVIARDKAIWRRLEIVRGSVLFLIIAAPWFVLVQHRNAEFFDLFFIREHFQRFASNRSERYGPWWYYAPILLVGAMPWLPGIIYQSCNRDVSVQPDTADSHFANAASIRPTIQAFRPDVFCIAWIAAIVVFFSLSHSKLPAYVMPVFPALALLAGRRDFFAEAGVLRWCSATSAVVGIVLMAASTQLFRLDRFAALGSEVAGGMPWIFSATACLCVGGIVGWSCIQRGRRAASVVAITLGSFVFWGCLFGFLHQIDAAFSSERMIEGLVKNERPFAPQAPFYSVGPIDYSVAFYLGRPMTSVNHRGEMDAGILAEPEKLISTVEQFQSIWKAGAGRAYAVMNPDRFGEMTRAGLPMNVVARDRRLVVVMRPEVLTQGPIVAAVPTLPGR